MVEEKRCGFCHKVLTPENIARISLLSCKDCRKHFGELIVLGMVKKSDVK